jgi:hypothetical protein
LSDGKQQEEGNESRVHSATKSHVGIIAWGAVSDN